MENVKKINERNMRKLIFSVIILSLCFWVSESYSQEPSKTELKQMFTKFKNYRFGNIAMYQVKNISEIRKAIEAKELASSGTLKVDDSAIQGIDEVLRQQVENAVKLGRTKDEIAGDLMMSNVKFEIDDLNKLFDYYVAKTSVATTERVENVFIITTKPERGKSPENIIAMITSTETSSNLLKNLKSVSIGNIYIYDELKNFELDSTYSATNMYDLIVNAFIQMNVQNRTTEMQGIGEPGFYYATKFGVTKSIASNERNYGDYDIQAFLKISNGEPHKLGLNQNEVILSPDYISWRHYEIPTNWDGSQMVIDSFSSSNVNLPEYGLEIKYGIDNINYHSFWSERLTAYALWKNAKLGIILPTAGWSNLSTDLLDQSRKLTNAGVGLAGEFDFPIKIIPKSGLFRMSFGYVFGDAIESDYKNRDLTIDYNQFNENYIDYLIRANFTFHYTFALAVDADYQFRFGFGVSGYDAERWYYKQIANENEEAKLNYQFFDDEFIFGLSGRAEFMAVNMTTPFGAYVQYFDEALSGNIWLQIPVYKNIIALKLETKAFSPLFRDNHPWEVGGLFTPMARFIVTF